MYHPESRAGHGSEASRPAPGRPAAERVEVSDYLLAMSHELRAPLNAVIGMSGLLLDGELSERQRQYVRSINAAGESLASTLNDLLDLSRILAGRLPVEPIPFDLRSMVEETASVLSPRAEDRGLALRVDWRPELPRQVVGDPGRIRQVLGNLVAQAVNATSQGEVVIRVAPDGDQDGLPLLRFSVEDTGIGLPPARLERVFDEYVPVDASPYRSFGVTGLGLRISAELVRIMAGEIGAESEVGKGSRFWFRLPLPTADRDAEPLALEQGGPRAGGRVLIVEADPAGRRRFEEQLGAAGWTADFADDLSRVEELLREATRSGIPYQAFLMSDYAVRPSHAEMATRIKADDLLRPIALVIVTAVGSPGEGKRLWHAGFAAYLRKPLPNEELHDALRALTRVAGDGRGSSLITRHSLAEARSAQATVQFDRLDEVLAGLTAPVTRQALVVGASGADQLEIAEALASCGLAVAPVPDLELASRRCDPETHELILIDADRQPVGSGATLAAFRSAGRSGTRPPIVGMTVDPTRRDELLAAGFDHVIAKPIRRADLDRVLRDGALPVEVAAPAPLPSAAPADEREEPAENADARHEPDAMEAEPVADAAPAPQGEAQAEDAAIPPLQAEAIALDPVNPEPHSTERAIESGPSLEIDASFLDRTDAGERLEVDEEPPPDLVGRIEDDELATGSVDGYLATGPFDEAGDDDAAPVEPIDLGSPAIEEPDELEPIDGLIGPGWAGEPAEPAGFLEDIVRDEPESIEPRPPSGPQPSQPAREPPTEEGPARPVALLGRPSGAGEIGTLTVVTPPPKEPPPVAVELNGRAVVVEEVATRSPLPVVSATLLEQLSSGAAGLARHLAATFLRDAPQRIAELASASARGDVGRLEQAIKSLNAMSGLIGATRLTELCGEMESGLQHGDLDATPARVEELEHAFLEIRAALEAALPPEPTEPAELPAVGESFLVQLDPARDAPARALALRLVATFRTEAPARLADLAEAISRGDAEAVQRVAPTLKGMCGLISANPLAKLCALVEADARLRRVASAGRYVDQLHFELARVLEALAQAVP
jgi:CheY-like chemotaxis protein